MTLQAGPWAAGQCREFFLLGRFTVRVDDRPLPGVDGGKIGELLGFLLLFRHQQHHREVLADAIWSGRTTTQARKYLRQGLWRIQSAFAGGLHDLLQVGSDWVWVNDDALEGLDIRKFEIVIQAVKGIAGRDLSAVAADDLQKACALYRGDLLEGWYQDWALYERHRYKARYISMLERLLEYAEAHRKLDDALFYGDRILEHDLRPRTDPRPNDAHPLPVGRSNGRDAPVPAMRRVPSTASLAPAQRPGPSSSSIRYAWTT